MILKTLATLFIAVLSISHASAFSFASKASVPVVPDSASGKTISGPNNSGHSKKLRFVSFATKKMSGWLNQIFPPGRKKFSVKEAFGLASFTFAFIWLFTIFAAGGGTASVVFFAGAIIFGITSLALRGDKSENDSSAKGGRSKKKGRNTLALIGLLLPIAITIIVMIAYGVYGGH